MHEKQKKPAPRQVDAIAEAVREVEALAHSSASAPRKTAFAGRQSRVFAGVGSAIEASFNLVEVLALCASERMRYAWSVRIDDRDWSIAHAVGQSRTLIALARGQCHPGVRRGADDARVDAEGALAEWAVAKAIGDATELERYSALVAHKAEKDVDAVAAGKRLDVKSVGQFKTQCYINRAQHESKRPDAYLIAHIARSDVVDVYVVSAAAVSTWPIYRGYSPCHHARMPGFLTPLPPLDASAE